MNMNNGIMVVSDVHEALMMSLCLYVWTALSSGHSQVTFAAATSSMEKRMVRRMLAGETYRRENLESMSPLVFGIH